MTQSLMTLKEWLEKYSTIQRVDSDSSNHEHTEYCSLLEGALEALLPAEGLRTWGKMTFDGLTRDTADPEIDPQTTALSECKRLSHEIERLWRLVDNLKNSVLRDGPSTLSVDLTQRTQNLHRKGVPDKRNHN